jgi:hypothetical protein
MNRAKFSGMSREEVVASMASKLAVGDGGPKVYKSKKKLSSKNIYILISAVVFLSGMTWLYMSQNDPPKESQVRGLNNASFIYKQNPLTKLKAAFHEDKISADYFALYLKDVLVRYDSIPNEFKVSRPVVKQNDVYRELSGVWTQLSPVVRSTITTELPQFRIREQDR